MTDVQKNEEKLSEPEPENSIGTETLFEQFQKRSQEETYPFLNGYSGPANIILNTGTINGSLFQNLPSGQDDAPLDLCVEEGGNFSRFYEKYRNSSVLPAMLVLAVLETVPENHFFFLCQELENHLQISSEQSADAYNHRFESLEALLAVLKAERVPAKMICNGTAVPIFCIIYAEPSYPRRIRQEIWTNYFQVRDAVTEWILEMKDTPSLQNVLDHQIMKGIFSLAGMNYSYALEHFIHSAGQPEYSKEILYLSGLMSELLKNGEYRPYTEQLLCKWLKEDGSRWRIAYQVYDAQACGEWTSLLRQKLKKLLRADISPSSGDFNRWYHGSRGYLIVPAHINRAAAVILVQTLSEIFRSARIFPEQEKVLLYYLILFREDCFYTNRQNWKMVLIDLCSDKEIRLQIRELLWMIWKNKKYRDILIEILNFHLSRLTKNNDWRYMQWFFKILGFTGTPQHYDNLYHVLEQSSYSEKSSILSWLEQLLTERRASQK